MYEIMIVDDDAQVLDMVELVLKREGYRVLRAYSAHSALTMLENTTPDLFVIDALLPEGGLVLRERHVSLGGGELLRKNVVGVLNESRLPRRKVGRREASLVASCGESCKRCGKERKCSNPATTRHDGRLSREEGDKSRAQGPVFTLIAAAHFARARTGR